MIWTRDGPDTHEYMVPRTMLSTGAYFGSPFQYVIRDPAELPAPAAWISIPNATIQVLHEMAAAGGTDYLALPLEYGDGSVQGLSLVAMARTASPTGISS